MTEQHPHDPFRPVAPSSGTDPAPESAPEPPARLAPKPQRKSRRSARRGKAAVPAVKKSPKSELEQALAELDGGGHRR